MNTYTLSLLSRVYPKELFISVSPITYSNLKGFALNQCTVLFNPIRDTIEITFFELSGKSKTTILPSPTEADSLYKVIKENSDERVIYRQTKLSYLSNNKYFK
jgi:hypothetical protein